MNSMEVAELVAKALQIAKVNVHQCTLLSEVCFSSVKTCSEICNGQSDLPVLVHEQIQKSVENTLDLITSYGSDDKWLWMVALRGTNTRAFAHICYSLYRCAILASNSFAIDLERANSINSALGKLPFTSLEGALEILAPLAQKDREELLFKVSQVVDSTSHVNGEIAKYILHKVTNDASPGLPKIEPLVLEGQIGESRRQVFRAKLWGKDVAVKQFDVGDLTFEKEGKVAKQDPDPHVVQHIGYYTKDEVNYLVMELTPTDLCKMLSNLSNEKELGGRKLVVPVLIKTDMMLQIACGMAYLHELNTVHRDIKPGNILVEDGYRMKITDFGTSKTDFVSFAASLTFQSGTYMFMAPEMMLGKPYSREVDVFSFGWLCYEILTEDVSRKFIASPDEIECPQELFRIIKRCWSISPKERPSFAGICIDLQRIKEDLILGRSLSEIRVPMQPPTLGRRSKDSVDREENPAEELKYKASETMCEILDAVGDAEANAGQCKFLVKACTQLNLCIQSRIRSTEGVDLLTELLSILSKALLVVRSCRAGWLHRKARIPLELHFRILVDDISSLMHAVSGSALALTYEDLSQRVQSDVQALQVLLGAHGLHSEFHRAYIQRRTMAHFINIEEIRFQEVIGRGGSGSVFRATWMGHEVAAKVMKKYESSDEFDVLLRIPPHPNVVDLIGISKQVGSGMVLVTELLNLDLHQLWKKSKREQGEGFPLSISLSLDIMLQVARGIEYLHRNNICHRDIKPMNVLAKTTDDSGMSVMFKLSDFGLSKADMTRTETTVIAGTFSYMAPSYVLTGEMSKRADIYSFGVLCCEIITGRTRLEYEIGDSESSEDENPGLKFVLRLRDLSTDLPGLSILIERCMSDKKDTTPTASEICDCLHNIKLDYLTRDLSRRPKDSHKIVEPRMEGIAEETTTSSTSRRGGESNETVSIEDLKSDDLQVEIKHISLHKYATFEIRGGCFYVDKNRVRVRQRGASWRETEVPHKWESAMIISIENTNACKLCWREKLDRCCMFSRSGEREREMELTFPNSDICKKAVMTFRYFKKQWFHGDQTNKTVTARHK